MSEIKVNSIKGVGASAAAITVNNTDGTCTANITNNLSNRNLIINGAMQVAQRGTSGTGSGYASVDRFGIDNGGLDEDITQAQVDVASGTSPYTSGFRKAYKITNGNQTSGAGATDFIRIKHLIEAQDVAQSGWNYTDSNSKITLQFWVKSSVAQNFYVLINSKDGTNRSFPIETGSLSADTWTKVTKTISGDSNLTFTNDNGAGIEIFFYLYLGTNYSDAGVSLDAWKGIANPQTPVNTTTWYTTNDATFEITGLQLEVGSTATDFEHLSFENTLAKCQRYCQVYVNPRLRGVKGSNATDYQRLGMTLLNTLRASPSATWSGTQGIYDGGTSASLTGISVAYVDTQSFEMDGSGSGNMSGSFGAAIVAYKGSDLGTLTLSAEL